jgi:cyclophilin family peptidyl-prolyl cis-trans isomerase
MRPSFWRALSQAGRMWQYARMKTLLIPFVALASLGAAPAPKPALAPSEIVAAAPASDWIAIAPADMLVMTLANGKQAVIQLMPPPFSQGWIGNIRKLAAAHWWDGLSINRVQDNYVVQWGDASEKKPLPAGLVSVGEGEYENESNQVLSRKLPPQDSPPDRAKNTTVENIVADVNAEWADYRSQIGLAAAQERDSYAELTGITKGWPIGVSAGQVWPVHCYAMVGVGRNLSPDTGSGAELYTVIGHAPRHLDRNIAVVGRVISGIENLSSLPRGTGALGFYEKAEERVGIISIRLASELPTVDQPRFEYLSTDSKSFAAYADARTNRRDAFFNVPAGGADICNIPVPVRKKP